MPKFYIDLRDKTGIVHDEEGAEYKHIEDALNEAKASAMSAKPSASKDQGFILVRGIRAARPPSAAIPTGTLMKNTHRQS